MFGLDAIDNQLISLGPLVCTERSGWESSLPEVSAQAWASRAR